MRAREIIEFWENVTTQMTELGSLPELVRRCENMAIAERLSKADLEKEVGGDLSRFFRRRLLATEIECNRRRGEP